MITVQRFFPHLTDWDGTDPAGGDVRKCDTGLPAIATNNSAEFGVSDTKQITVDPATAGRTTTGVAPEFGFAVNIAGADGMDSTATAKRRIPAGTWFFQGMLVAGPAASLAACTVGMYVYRVAASPSTTRTLLFSDSVAVGLVAPSGTNWSRTTAAQSEILLEAGETIQVTFTLTCTGQAGGLLIDFRLGDASTLNDTFFDVPSPGVRTQYQETVTVTAVGTAAVTFGTKTLTGVVRDSAGVPVGGATVKLFDEATDTRISTDVTGADGVYGFTRTDVDTARYYCVGYTTDVLHGTTDRGLTST